MDWFSQVSVESFGDGGANTWQIQPEDNSASKRKPQKKKKAKPAKVEVITVDSEEEEVQVLKPGDMWLGARLAQKHTIGCHLGPQAYHWIALYLGETDWVSLQLGEANWAILVSLLVRKSF